MSNEEQTQIFRGDDLPPEIGIAETGGPVQRRRPAAPSDQRSLHDQSNGPSDTRQLHDSRDELADLRQLHDTSGAAESRKMGDAAGGPADASHVHDAAGPSDVRSLQDGDGVVDANHAQDGQGPSDQRSMHDAQGLVYTNHAHDGDGPSDQRRMNDAQGPVLQHQMHDASAVPPAAAQQQAHSFHDDEVPEPEAEAGMVTLNSTGEVVDPDPNEAPTAAKTEAPMPDADLTFKVEEDATPWALSIHLEARIASLTESTAKVNEQLGGLEDSIKRLAKRIGK